jgi:O-antigen ligase
MIRLGKIAEWLFYGLFFMFPLVPRLTSLLLAGLLLIGLITTRLDQYKARWKSHRVPIILCISFFLLHLVSLLYTEDMEAGWKAVEIKLSFLLVPLLFIQSLTFRVGRLRVAFLSGLVAASAVCIVHSFYISSDIGIENAFAVSRFSFLIHPSYFGALLVVGLVTLYCYPLGKHSRFVKGMNLLIGLLLLFSLYATTSKQAFISLVLVITVIVVWEFMRPNNRYLKWSVVGVSALLLLIVFGTKNTISKRFEEMFVVVKERDNVNTASTESNRTRVLVWSSAMELIRENPIVGVGAGDGGSALIEQNKLNGYTGVVEKKYNAHNQFLATTIAVGFVGLLLLCLILLSTLITAIKKRHLWSILVIVILASSLTTESFLEKQTGVVPFVLFVSIIVFGHAFSDVRKDKETDLA